VNDKVGRITFRKEADGIENDELRISKPSQELGTHSQHVEEVEGISYEIHSTPVHKHESCRERVVYLC